MNLKLNNCELVAVLNAVQNYLDYIDDDMVEASLMSFASKINDNSRSFNRLPEQLAIDTRAMLDDIKILKEVV